MSTVNRGIVLVVEDGPESAELVASLLRAEGFTAVVCGTAAEGIAAMSRAPVAVVLDWGLPDRPGLEVCREIRAADEEVAILFVSGRTDEASVTRGLDAGADDFIQKPFRTVEFIARIEAQLRRRRKRPEVVPAAVSGPERRRFGAIEIDLAARQVLRLGIPINLGPLEYSLIEYLVENAGVALSREQILERVYGYSPDNSTDRVDLLARRVRNKLGGAGHLIAVVGYGYRWETRRA